MRIAVLALEGVFDTGLATVLDAFATANELARVAGIDMPTFEVAVVGMRPQVRSGLGLQVPVCGVGDAASPNWVIVPAISAKMPDVLVPALGREDVANALP
ncbi:hypothetical protein ABTL01_19650, partial [Acinetobacter baumannii]